MLNWLVPGQEFTSCPFTSFLRLFWRLSSHPFWRHFLSPWNVRGNFPILKVSIFSSFSDIFDFIFHYCWFCFSKFFQNRIKNNFSEINSSLSFVHFLFYFLPTMTDMITINREVMLSQDELLFLGLITEEEIKKRKETSQEEFRATFRGSKLRTKFSFWCKMYANEIGEWIEEDESREVKVIPQRFRHRAHTTLRWLLIYLIKNSTNWSVQILVSLFIDWLP